MIAYVELHLYVLDPRGVLPGRVGHGPIPGPATVRRLAMSINLLRIVLPPVVTGVLIAFPRIVTTTTTFPPRFLLGPGPGEGLDAPLVGPDPVDGAVEEPGPAVRGDELTV